MQKVQVKLATLGHIPHNINVKTLVKWKSDLFQISPDIDSYTINENADGENWEYTDEALYQELFTVDCLEDILVVLTHVPLQDNFFVGGLLRIRSV